MKRSAQLQSFVLAPEDAGSAAHGISMACVVLCHASMACVAHAAGDAGDGERLRLVPHTAGGHPWSWPVVTLGHAG